MHTIAEICRREPYFVYAEQTVLDVSRYMAERNIGGVSVLEKQADGSAGRVVGIFTERDLMMRVVVRMVDPASTPVRQVMTPNPVVVTPGETVEKCLLIMKQAGCRHLPVLDGGRLAGMISMRDLLQAEIDERAEEVDLMRSYIHSVPPGMET